MSRYAIGLDFGTLSVRALVLDTESGEEICNAVVPYPHGVIEKDLPTGFALQDPADYIEGMTKALRRIFSEKGIAPESVVGVGVDFTASTLLPIKKDGTPLSFLPEFAHEPHALAKLWKHHGAQKEAEKIRRVFEHTGYDLRFYGGNVFLEWTYPKVLETLNLAPQVYRAADYFIEAMDYITLTLTGRLARSEICAAFKAFYQKENDPKEPTEEFLALLHPEMAHFVRDKLIPTLLTTGTAVGGVSPEMARKTGLLPNTPVAVGMIDAHAGVLGSGVHEAGVAMVIAGTSGCHLFLGEKGVPIPGFPGIIKDGILPGLYCYEAGQSCMGDLFDRFVQNFVPASYERKAKEKGVSVHRLLEEKASAVFPGESGLVALDWANGVRSPYMDSNLSGLILGLDLNTTPEEIYLALIEGCAFGTRRILEDMEQSQTKIRSILLGGGIPFRNRLFCQVFADVCKAPIRLAGSTNASARGSAILGAVAAGERGGFSSLREAVEKLGRASEEVFLPDPERSARYDELYREYRALSAYFAEGANHVMYRLKKMRKKRLSDRNTERNEI